MNPIRRAASILALMAMTLPITLASAGAAEMKVTLMGTGSPVPSPNRFSQSTLVEAGDQALVFDMGRGVSIRLAQLDIPLGSVDAHFITHLHSDHLDGLTDLWGTGWLPTPFGSRTSPMVIHGPEGTVAMTDNLTEAFAADISIRLADEKLPLAGIAFDAHDEGPGIVYEKDGVTVSAFDVDHGELIKPSFGYKIEYDGKTVVISGDTRRDERVAQQAMGADLLIHEVADIDPGLMETFPRFREITDHHTTPEQAGEIFSMARPKLAAYSHIIALKPGQGLAEDQDASTIIARTRTTYDGPLVAGTDLMSFVIGDDGITVSDASGDPVLTD